ncbi:Zinc finger C-x8-C-x5-C-x3-H type domain containing protein, putative [Babesia bigemina]|uniref:Zinc finger C-x8-C-x5-C-x3-H type domain containing protein, putative n=2 Tax=Babesia bigemina TaxID=5866 RepID=A0A061DDA3_BABBI|nr:Zinc finger C-x8-C-x5-C-x3-H type domain containing protein, putative [Babesia bigemina]CDR97224.1 Zinc finger C-x8-C-x5-C-x3-H type domain containing protein, putative [Babesia bigemina]|eukprot:XP_012769410.1 Zinc finger C-x8-C-x5-C-x3-H type domain containing protein, putative [Babesia bigemina]
MSMSEHSEPTRDVRVISVEQFHKTKLCPHMNKPEGCLRSMRSHCPYAHSADELKEPPNLIKTAMCKLHLKGNCDKTSEECPYAHSFDELRHTDGFYKTFICKFWEKGYCKAGSMCRYAHGTQELRRVSSDVGHLRSRDIDAMDRMTSRVTSLGEHAVAHMDTTERNCTAPTSTSAYSFNRTLPSPLFVYPVYGDVTAYSTTPTASGIQQWVPSTESSIAKEQDEAFYLMHYYLQKYIECSSKQQSYLQQQRYQQQGYMAESFHKS